MTSVQNFFNALSHDRLREVVKELEGLSQTGKLPSNVVSDLARELSDSTGLPYYIAMTLCQSEPLRVAAFRWVQGA